MIDNCKFVKFLVLFCLWWRRIIAEPLKPLCTDIKKYPYMQNGAFITRDPGHWRYRVDGSREYVIDTCRLKRFTSSEARSCLAGHHLVFIGDSVTRYQFLSLAYFIERGEWPYRFDIPEGDRQGRNCMHFDRQGKPTCHPWSPIGNVAAEMGWGHYHGHDAEQSWKKMHMYIGSSGFNGRMECQCVRDSAEFSTEAMFYESSNITNPTKRPNRNDNPTITNSGPRRDPNIAKISFLNDISVVPMHAWRRSHCSRNAACNLTESDWYALRKGAHQRSWDFVSTATDDEFRQKYLEKLVPDADIALFNRGLWSGWPNNREEMSKVMKSLYELATVANGGTCYWKGTSPSTAGAMSILDSHPTEFARREAEIRHDAYVQGCGVFDLSHVTQAFATLRWAGDVGRKDKFPEKIPNDYGEREQKNVYLDASHFQPWVSEELNQVLLNVLC